MLVNFVSRLIGLGQMRHKGSLGAGWKRVNDQHWDALRYVNCRVQRLVNSEENDCNRMYVSNTCKENLACRCGLPTIGLLALLKLLVSWQLRLHSGEASCGEGASCRIAKPRIITATAFSTPPVYEPLSRSGAMEDSATPVRIDAGSNRISVTAT